MFCYWGLRERNIAILSGLFPVMLIGWFVGRHRAILLLAVISRLALGVLRSLIAVKPFRLFCWK
jgi:hypothetical protein